MEKQNGFDKLKLNRRSFLATSSGVALSAASILLLSGNEVLAANAKMGKAAGKEQDISILNTALALEHEGINAYQIGAESGLLSKDILSVAVSFQSHHKEHREALIATIKKLGGKPVAEKDIAFYKESLEVGKLKSQEDVLRLAARLEMGAISAYIGVMPSFENREITAAAAKLLADEVMHWTTLTSVLKQALPSKGLTFGS